MPTSLIAWVQENSIPSIYLAKLSDHNFYLKLTEARAKRPDILVLGSSRANQWRSGMFSPYSFYNAANVIYNLSDFTLFLERMGKPFPKLIIFSLDFFTFNDEWAARFTNLLHDDITCGELPLITKKFLKEVWASPRDALRAPRDPIYGVPAIGLSASNLGVGFRIDGSYQYGWAIRGGPSRGATIENALARISTGEEPFQFADRLDVKQLRELRRFAAFARHNQISLVGVTMPYPVEVLDAVEHSNRHRIWQEFRKPRFRELLSEEKIIYFDFSRADAFGGNDDGFVDAFHSTEPAYVRMLLRMLKDPGFRALVPKLDASALELRLQNSNRFEAFRNEF